MTSSYIGDLPKISAKEAEGKTADHLLKTGKSGLTSKASKDNYPGFETFQAWPVYGDRGIK
jgi:hypothetical protein